LERIIRGLHPTPFHCKINSAINFLQFFKNALQKNMLYPINQYRILSNHAGLTEFYGSNNFSDQIYME
jgi:hypothetical protein